MSVDSFCSSLYKNFWDVFFFCFSLYDILCDVFCSSWYRILCDVVFVTSLNKISWDVFYFPSSVCTGSGGAGKFVPQICRIQWPWHYCDWSPGSAGSGRFRMAKVHIFAREGGRRNRLMNRYRAGDKFETTRISSRHFNSDVSIFWPIDYSPIHLFPSVASFLSFSIDILLLRNLNCTRWKTLERHICGLSTILRCILHTFECRHSGPITHFSQGAAL